VFNVRRRRRTLSRREILSRHLHASYMNRHCSAVAALLVSVANPIAGMSGRDHSPSCLLYSLVPSGGKTYSSTFLREWGESSGWLLSGICCCRKIKSPRLGARRQKLVAIRLEKGLIYRLAASLQTGHHREQ